MTVEEAGDRARVRGGRPPTRQPSEFIEVELMRALSDEMRVRIWAYLCEHTAGAPEIAKAIGESQNGVRFHVGELASGEWIEPVASSGRAQKFRARRQSPLPPGIWERLPEDLRQHVGVRLLRIFYTDAKESMEAGSFFRPGVHPRVSR